MLDWISFYLTAWTYTHLVRFNSRPGRHRWLPSFLKVRFLGRSSSLTAEVILVVEKHGFNVQAYMRTTYADDSRVPSGTASLLLRIATCIDNVSIWMSSNRPCFNLSKTEIIWFGSSRRLQNTYYTDTEKNVLGSLNRTVDYSVRDLGVLIDSGLTLSNHVNKVAALLLSHLTTSRATNTCVIFFISNFSCPPTLYTFFSFLM